MATSIDLRTHEIVERRMVARYVKRGDLVLEGGAGIGAVTRVLLDAGAEVTAYEPGAYQFQQLQRVADAYPDTCQVVHAALSDHTGDIPLHIYDSDVWYADRTTALGGHVPVRTERVPAHDFNETLRARPWDGLVLDVEGAEHDLIYQAICIPSLRWIVVELHGSPEQMATTMNHMPKSFILDAIEVNQVYLVAGWVRA